MNANLYKLIFSQHQGQLVVVGEHACRSGKSAGGESGGGSSVGPLATPSVGGFYLGVLRSVFAAGLMGMAGVAQSNALDANTLPTGAAVQAGSVSHSVDGSTMNIVQSTQRAVVNYESFNIGRQATVNHSGGVMLARVTGAGASRIEGTLNTSGMVLVNPNGIAIGSTANINAGSFTASTLNISNDDFMAGRLRFERNGTEAGVVNEGTITTEGGGYVALVGATVDNHGRIATQGGDVVLASGQAATISVPLSASGRVKLELDAGALNAAVANHADGVIVTEGGHVLMRAAALVDATSGNIAPATVTHMGQMDTSGEQGGRVDILADHGTVRVSGSIKANSTGTNPDGTLKAGGDIFIGRDEDTNVLAAVGDASGAQLESLGGFVETSGAFLKTTGTRVKAKDWLLDPFNITIVSGVATGTDYSAWSPGADSTILASDIAANLNAGTSVTIATGLLGSAGSSDGNIVVNAAIVKSGSSDATLTLIANNGITVNQRIGLAAADTTSTGKLDVVMTANGDATNALNSQGITLNSVIDANGGQVTLTGTSKNTFGIQTGPNYTYGVTNNSRSGVVFNGGSGITAENYQITGTHTVAAGNSFGVNGVYMNSAVTFKTTGNTNSNITGNSNAQGNFGAGVMVWDGATIRLENQGIGVTTLKGENTNSGGGNGIRIGASTNTAVINIIGRVNIGQQTVNTNAPIFFRGTINASQNSANLSGLSILGQTGLNISAVQLWDTRINAAGIDVVVDGITTNATGVYIQNAGNTTWTTKNLTVTGVANTTVGASGRGVQVQRYANVLTVNASGNIDIEGTVQGTGAGRGLYFAESGWGAQAPRLVATSNITLRGNNRASASNTNEAVYIASGVQAIAGGDIVLQGETNNAAVNTIHLFSAATGFTNWNTAGASALFGNTTLQATANVLIQANQGGIYLNNQLSSTLNNGGTPLLTSDTKITGRNISIDNTGGTVDAVTGVITRGTGGSISGNAGIHINDGRSITALNNINIYGVGNTGHGVNISGAAQISAGSAGYTGNLNINGVNTSTDVASINVGNTSALLSAQNLAVLTSGLKASGNSLNVSGQIQVGVELQVENPNAGTISGVISGTGLLRKRGGTGSGTLTLLGNNTYTGGTVANGGTLQVGNGGTIGTLGNGAISVAAVLSINRSDTYTIADNISGSGQLWQIGTGTSVLTGTNTYSGLTAINAGVLQVGNGGSTGTLGTGNLTLNNTSLIFQRADNVLASNSITGTGNIYATSTGGGVTLSNMSLAGNLSASAAGSIALTNAGVINFSARTTGNNGNITLTNTAGTTTVTTVNGISGVSTHGSGNVNLSSASTSGYGLYLQSNISAIGGDVTLSGTTSATITAPTPLSGVFSSATVTAKNITMTAQSTGGSGHVLGYYGAGGVFEASEALSLTGTSQGTGNGLYSFGGRYTSGTGMTLVGTSVAGQGVNFDASMVVSNGASGNISVTGTATNATLTAIGMRGVSMTNAGGDISLVANSGQVIANTGNPDWGMGVLSNTITQNGTGSVLIRSQGDGNITVPIIVNNGNGNVVVAAGSNLTAGTGTGGQVLTVSGNTISQNGTGKTLIYSGQASSTGQLSHLTSAFNNLYYQGSSQPINAQFNTAYSSTITGGANAQLLFREASANAPGFTIALSDISQTYGDAEFTLAARNTALLNAYTGAGTLTSTVSGANGGSHTFAVTAADVIDGLTGTARAAGANVGTYAYTNISGSAFNTTVSAQPSLVIDPRDITLTSITAATKVYDGSTTASITGGTFGNIVAGESLALGGSGYFNSPNVSDVSTVTVDDVTTLTKPSGGSGSWSNYNLVTTGAITSSATGKITRAPLTATVNNSSIFVTQLASSAPDMGVTYSGFVNGEVAASVLSGTAVRSYTGAASYPATGTYAGVFGLSQTPTAANYQITVVSGDLTVIPADKLVITIQSQSAEYGSQTAANLGAAGATTVSAQYCFDQNDCNGANLVDLNVSKLTETRWKAADNTGSHVVFDTSVLAPSYSTGGYLEAGNYNFNASEITPMSLFTNGQPNFTGRAVNAGVLTVEAREIIFTAANENKTADGTLKTQTLITQGLLAGDQVNIEGLATGTTEGTYNSLLRVNAATPGADRGNYRIVFVNGAMRIVGAQLPGGSTRPGRADTFEPRPPVLPASTESASEQASTSLAGGSNPFQLAGSDLPDMTDPKCNLEDLSNCRCDTMQSSSGNQAVGLETSQVCYQPVN